MPRTGRLTGTTGPRRSPAEAQAQHHQLPGRHTIFQCPICSPRSSPGSRVQSSRGAVREMQLRFLSTLLRMVPTPPPLPPPPLPPLCRFRHLPPRLREPVSLSCRIRECPGLPCRRCLPESPPAPPTWQLRSGGSASRLREGSLESSKTAAGARARGSRRSADTAGATNARQPVGICSAEPARLRLKRAWGGEEGGSELMRGRGRRCSRLQSRHYREQAGQLQLPGTQALPAPAPASSRAAEPGNPGVGG